MTARAPTPPCRASFAPIVAVLELWSGFAATDRMSRPDVLRSRHGRIDASENPTGANRIPEHRGFVHEKRHVTHIKAIDP